jgi:hypothetical protein
MNLKGSKGGSKVKKFISFALMVLLGLVLGPLSANSGEYKIGAVTHSKDFEKMKGLVGVWEGTTEMGKEMGPVKATYELTSAGNAILERLFVGLPHEMVTVYYDSKGKLTMTHYCSLGNQPHMELMNPGENNMLFVLSEKDHGLSSLDETHMHALKISFNTNGSITHTWSLYEKGEKKSDVVIKLARSKF